MTFHAIPSKILASILVASVVVGGTSAQSQATSLNKFNSWMAGATGGRWPWAQPSQSGPLPRGAQEFLSENTDLVDRLLHDLTIETNMEIGATELLDDQGRLLDYEFYTSANDQHIDGLDAGWRLFDRIKTGGWADRIVRVRKRHSHPNTDSGYPEKFSPGDYSSMLYFKAFWEVYLRRPIEFESDIVFGKTLSSPQKRVAFLPKSISALTGAYVAEGYAAELIAKKAWPPEHLQGSAPAPTARLASESVSIYRRLSKQIWKKYEATLPETFLVLERSLSDAGFRVRAERILNERQSYQNYVRALGLLIDTMSSPMSVANVSDLQAIVERTRGNGGAGDASVAQILSDVARRMLADIMGGPDYKATAALRTLRAILVVLRDMGTAESLTDFASLAADHSIGEIARTLNAAGVVDFPPATRPRSVYGTCSGFFTAI